MEMQRERRDKEREKAKWKPIEKIGNERRKENNTTI